MIDALPAPQHQSRRWLALALAGVLSCGALAACAGGSSSDGGSKGSSSQIADRTAAPGKPQSDTKIALLRVGIEGSIPTLNPTENIGSGLYVNSLGLESLLTLDKDGELKPWLASAFKEVSPTVYEYTLRKGVKFWDGSELTSEDVKFSYELRMSGDTSNGFFAGIVDKVEAPDPYTVRVTLTKPNSSWKNTPALYYSNIIQKKNYEAAGDKFGQPGTLLVGTGPWKFDNLNPTTGMEMSAFDDYWGGKPNIGKISIKSYTDDNSMALAMRAGEVDFAPFVNGPKGFDAAAGGGTTTTVPICATALLALPTTTAPFDDIYVRRAIAHAIDRKDLVASTQGRAGGPLETLISPILLKSLDTPDKVTSALDSIPGYDYDLKKAKAELAKSKVPDGFKAKIVTTASGAATIEVIAAQLKKIGIDLTIDSVGDTEYGSLVTTDPGPLTFTESGACAPDPSWDDLFLGKDGVLNIANYTPPEVDQLLSDGVLEQDPAKRLAIYTKLLTKVSEDVPYVPIYEEGNTNASKTYKLADFGSYYLSMPWALNLEPK